jgi:hypothetical protein
MIHACVAAVTFLLAIAVPAAAEDADITGRWDVTISMQQGPQSAPLILKKDGDKIGGTFSGPQGDVPVEATVKEKAVTIWFSVPTQDGPHTMTMTGTVEQDAMSGSIDFAGRGQAQWSAKRTASNAAAPPADARLDLSGTWAFSVETGAGSGTPTITLNQQGEKLTGHYSGQLGEAPLTGTVKGTSIEFAIDVSVQDTALHVVYSGTAGKDAMNGTVRLGDLGGGTFTAKKSR